MKILEAELLESPTWKHRIEEGPQPFDNESIEFKIK